jgi:hypothetical protein
VEWDPRLGISSLIYGNEIYGKIITYLWIIGGLYGFHNTYEVGCASKYDIFSSLPMILNLHPISMTITPQIICLAPMPMVTT